MLKVPRLDDISYDQIISRAINRIPGRTDAWTDFNAHDPGVTVLETYGWLVDMLNYYMNATGDLHVQKYLKLLGIRQRRARAAGAYLNVASPKPVLIPKGLPVFAGNICFEIAETCEKEYNRFLSYINEIDGEGMDLTMFAGADGDYADLFAPSFLDQAVAYFGFERPLSGEVDFQICIKETGLRNEFTSDFSLANLQWQFYGPHGWQEPAHVKDETCGFLRSGFLHISFQDATVSWRYASDMPAAHYIRCILKENTYDLLPKVGAIQVNPVFVQQKETVSRTETIVYEGQDFVEIPCYIPKECHLMIGVEEGSQKGSPEQWRGGFLIYDEGALWEGGVSVNDGSASWQRIIDFSKGNLRPKRGSLLRIFLVRRSFTADFTQGRTDGCAWQQIPFDCPGLCDISVSTWKKEKGGYQSYQLWTHVADLKQAGSRDYVFTYDEQGHKLMFGDGIHGVVPTQGQKICITGLSLSRFQEGNVMEGEINQILDPSFLGVKIQNPRNAAGGQNLEPVSEMLKRMSDTLFTQERMVAPEDYKEAVRTTPGLLIEAVEVISGKRYGQIHGTRPGENEVFVVVKPRSKNQRPRLSEFYKERILDHVEEKRLLNTKVSVVSPSYVGVEVNGRIRLAHLKTQEQEAVLTCIEEAVKPEEDSLFGQNIVLGKLFTKLETLPEVRQIEHLSLERIGQGAIKNQRGDLLLYEDALSYLKEIRIEFC